MIPSSEQTTNSQTQNSVESEYNSDMSGVGENVNFSRK